MNDEPLVSIIMGIYNCELTLEEAVQSILNQTYKNWELIMCDDGSADRTYEVAKRLREKYSGKIVLLQNQTNMGLNKTLNRCLKEAKGKYIARMDGDDISLPDRLQKEVMFLESHAEYSMVSTPMIYFDKSGEWGCGSAIERPVLRDFVFHAPCFCHAPVLVRKEVYDDVGGYSEDKFLLRFEDCDLWYKIYSKGYKGANLQEPLYKMRDDRDAYKRRTIDTRLRAVYVQYHGFRMVRMKWFYYPVLVKDIIKGIATSIMPHSVYSILHKARLSKRRGLQKK